MTQREIIGKTPKISKLAVALAIAGLMIIGGFVALASSQPTATSPPASAAATTASPTVLTTNSIQPNPLMMGNITWSSFQSNWSNPLTYQSGANVTDTSILPASLNTGVYTNPITVNPADIVAPTVLQGDKIGTQYWNNSANWAIGSILYGDAIAKTANGSYNGQQTVETTMNTSNTNSNLYTSYMTIPITALPSNNPSYDYITMIYGMTGPSLTGSYAEMQIRDYTSEKTGTWTAGINSTTEQLQKTGTTINTGQYGLFTASLQQMNNMMGAQPLFNLTGTNSITNIQIMATLHLPAATGDNTYTLTIYGLAITETPLNLGTVINNNSPSTAVAMSGNAMYLSQLNANFKYTAIENGGYTAAVAQSFNQSNDPTVSQAAISQGNYIEQVTYQSAGYKLPTATDLTYGTFTMTQTMNGIAGSQYVVANLGGVSYTTQINKLNGTTAMYYGIIANPNTNSSMILTLDYTASQWNSVSGAPPFFSLAGLEYYWWVGLIGFFSLIGLGSAALAHWGGEEENLRTPKGKFGR